MSASGRQGSGGGKWRRQRRHWQHWLAEGALTCPGPTLPVCGYSMPGAIHQQALGLAGEGLSGSRDCEFN